MVLFKTFPKILDFFYATIFFEETHSLYLFFQISTIAPPYLNSFKSLINDVGTQHTGQWVLPSTDHLNAVISIPVYTILIESAKQHRHPASLKNDPVITQLINYMIQYHVGFATENHKIHGITSTLKYSFKGAGKLVTEHEEGTIAAVLCLTGMFNAALAFDDPKSIGTSLINAFAAESAKGNSLRPVKDVLQALGE